MRRVALIATLLAALVALGGFAVPAAQAQSYSPPPSSSPAPDQPAPGAAPPKRDSGKGRGSESASAGCKGRPNCVTLGRDYPLERYELDTHVESELTDADTWFPALLQWLIGFIWFAILKLVDAVLRLLEWSFSVKLFGDADQNGLVTEDSFADSLGGIFDALGSSWMTLGILVAAGWAMWNGLVRMRTIETLGGLAGTLALMIVALTVTVSPGKTVGQLSSAINEASGSAFAIASTASVTSTDEAQGDAHQKLFASLVMRPWCALQFYGDPTKCSWENDWEGDGTSETLADAYLNHDANTDQREAVYNKLVDIDDGRWTRWQGLDFVSGRFGLLVLILVGMIGALALLVTIAVRLLLAVLEVLLLLLFVPVVLPLPAFGEGGRAATVAYIKRILGRMVDQLILALFFGVVVFGANTVQAVGNDFSNQWLLICVYWWGIFIKRDEIFGLFAFIDGEHVRTPRGVSMAALGAGYLGARGAKAIGGGLFRGGRATARGTGRVVGDRWRRDKEADRRVDGSVARDKVTGHMHDQHEARSRDAEGVLSERQSKRDALNANQQRQRELSRQRDDLLKGKPMVKDPKTGEMKPLSGREIGKQLDEKNAELRRLDADATHLRSDLDKNGVRYGEAEQFLKTADQHDPASSERAYSAAADRRLSEINDQDITSAGNLHAAGYTQEEYRNASMPEKERILVQAGEAQIRDRALLKQTRDREGKELRYVERAAPSGMLTGRDNRKADAHKQIKGERKEKRKRDKIYRR